MAFNLLVELTSKEVDWNSINKNLKEQGKNSIEFFPIPNFSNTSINYIGISVVNNDINFEKIEAFKNSIKYFLQNGNKVFELYSSREFLENNLESLSRHFFKV